MHHYMSFPKRLLGRGWWFFLLLGSLMIPPCVGRAQGESQNIQISNRAPRSDEVNYFPEEGTTCPLTPPGFVWLAEEGADHYILQCATRPDFSFVEYEVQDVPHNVHCPAYLIESSTWYWRYQYFTKEGKPSDWSRVRKFIIPPDAVAFPQPQLLDLLTRLPAQHPKLFLRPDMVKPLLEKLTTQQSEVWKRFIQHADEELEMAVVTDEPPPYPSGGLRTSDKADIDVWRKNYSLATRSVEHAANLAFAYQMTGEEKYGERAKEWVMAVMAWPPEGTTSYRMNDECAMPILSRLSRAYTWIYPLFNATERKQVVEIMKIRADEVYQHLLARPHTAKPFDSHNNRAWHFLGEAAIAFTDDIPEAKLWLQYVMDIFYTVYPVWNDDEGGWHEGVAYWNSYLDRITWWLDILYIAFGINGYQKPFFKHGGDFALYVDPPGSEFGGFGDSSDTLSWMRNTELMKRLAQQSSNPYWMWYAQQDKETGLPEAPTYPDLLRLRYEDVPPQSPKNLAQSKIFHGVGIASLHTNLSQSNNDVHVLFKSSPFGSQSHGFNPQNAFELSVYGKPLLLWSGHRDWHGSEHHKTWMWETSSDNCVTVNGVGQRKHSSLARGRLVREFINDRYNYVAGDATEAYEGRVGKYIRHLIFLKPDIVILVDELETPEPSSFQLFFHSNNEFNIHNAEEVRTNNQESAVRIAFATRDDMEISQSNVTKPPSIGFNQTQWHLKVETREKHDHYSFISFLKTHQTNQLSEVLVQKQSEGNVEAYGFLVNRRQRVGLVWNPTRKVFHFGFIDSNASLILINEEETDKRIPNMLAIEASYLEVAGRTMLESPQRVNHFVPREQLLFITEKP